MHKKKIAKLNSDFTILKANKTFIRRKAFPPECRLPGEQVCIVSSRKSRWHQSHEKAASRAATSARAHSHSAQTNMQCRSTDGKTGSTQRPGLPGLCRQVCREEWIRGEGGESLGQDHKGCTRHRHTPGAPLATAQVWIRLPTEREGGSSQLHHTQLHHCPAFSRAASFQATWDRGISAGLVHRQLSPQGAEKQDFSICSPAPLP